MEGTLTDSMRLRERAKLRNYGTLNPALRRGLLPRSESLSPEDDSQSKFDDSQQKRHRLIRTACMSLFYLTLNFLYPDKDLGLEPHLGSMIVSSTSRDFNKKQGFSTGHDTQVNRQGMYGASVAVSIIDLQDIVDSNVEEFSFVMMSKSIGSLVGAAVGSIATVRLERHTDLCLFCFSTVAGITCILFPWSVNIIMMGILHFLQGVCHGSTFVVISTVLLGEWGDAAAGPVNLLHTMLSVGPLLAPVTLAPFLSSKTEVDMRADSPSYTTDSSRYTESTTDLATLYSISPNVTNISDTRIHIPFAIYGALGVLVGVSALYFYLKGWEHYIPNKYHGMPQHRRFSLIPVGPDKNVLTGIGIALFIIYFSQMLRNVIFGTYHFYIAIESAIHMSKVEASLFSTVYSASWLVGHLAGAVLPHCVSIHLIVFGGLALTLVDTVFLVIYGLENEYAFWILTCGIGVFSGPCYGSIMAWVNCYSDIRGFMVAVIVVGAGGGSILASWLGGYLLFEYGAWLILVVMVSCTACALLTLVPIQIVFSVRGDRFETEPLIVDGPKKNRR